jgi:hypothetical protein
MVHLSCQQETMKGTTMAFQWHRDGRGGYKAEHTDHDASATIGRTASPRKSKWVVVTYVFGRELDRAYFAKIADAKWHAEAVVSVACVGPQG